MDRLDNAVVWARDLRKSFGDNPALRGITVGIREREALAITGPSGSGKSTLLHCLAGILPPTSGEVWYGSTPLHALAERRRTRLRREHFGVVFQFPQLVPELTVEENVALPLLFGGRGRDPSRAAAREWLERLDLADLRHTRAGHLSAGQMQRAAIARALAVQPAVLFADEPTGALDSREGRSVLRILSSIVRSQGTTLVLVTHDTGVATYAEREVTLRDGQVVPVAVYA